MKSYIYLFLIALGLILLIGTCTNIDMPGYSSGVRTGKLVKFSNKGMICKTWEGELMIGQSNHSFDFTVKDKALIDTLQNSIGKELSLRYEENYITGICNGDTDYFVVKLE